MCFTFNMGCYCFILEHIYWSTYVDQYIQAFGLGNWGKVVTWIFFRVFVCVYVQHGEDVDWPLTFPVCSMEPDDSISVDLGDQSCIQAAEQEGLLHNNNRTQQPDWVEGVSQRTGKWFSLRNPTDLTEVKCGSTKGLTEGGLIQIPSLASIWIDACVSYLILFI